MFGLPLRHYLLVPEGSNGHVAAESIVRYMLESADARAFRWPDSRHGLHTLMEGVERWSNDVRSFRVDKLGFTGGVGGKEGGSQYKTRSKLPRLFPPLLK